MKVTSRWAGFAAAVVVVVGLGVAGLAIPGCAPAPDTADEPVAPAPESTTVPAPEEPAAPPPPAAEEPPFAPTEEPKEPAPKEPSAPEPKEPAVEEPMAPTPEPEKPEKSEKPPAEKAAVKVDVDPSKVSTYAPADDLVSQVPEYLDELEEAVESEDEFAESRSKLVKDANAFILIALALGLHDTDNKYKQAAPAMIKAAQDVAAAENYAEAEEAIEALKTAATAEDGDPSKLKWEKVASLKALMEAVPLINSRLKRYMRGSRFEREAETTTGLTAVLAVIAQGSMANAEETEKPGEVEKWHAQCVQFRDAAVAVHAAIRAQDESAAEAAMDELQQSCDDCHAIFHPEEAPAAPKE